MPILSLHYQSASYIAEETFLAPQLKELFPAHASVHNCITQIKGSEKTAPVVRRAASLREYSTHLSRSAQAGVGALGMYLGERFEVGRVVWWATSFIALDVDDKSPADLVPFITTLAGSGVHAYVTTGTTGRGAHVYIFLNPSLHQKRAYDAVKLLQTVAHDTGLGRPEIRPSSVSGIGSPIFLPYRAAGEDGFGVNPLLDPEDEFRPISLADTCEKVKRVLPETLEAFCRELSGKVSEPAQCRATSPKKALERSTPQSGNSLTLLEEELKRIADKFVEPHRQDLIMGVTAYGVRKLGLDGAKVRVAVEEFIKKNDSNELNRRLEAVDRTIEKHASGKLVAWREFYERAGVAVPYRLGASKELLDQLELAGQLLVNYTWSGRGGASECSVYAALLKVAAAHGVLHDNGIAVSISGRNLAVDACLGDVTRQKALKRLTNSGFVRRDLTVKRSAEDAGVLIILMDRVHKLSHSFSQAGGLKEWDSLYTHPAFMHGKLGKSAAPLVITLREAELPLTRPELAKQLGRESRDIRAPLTRLLNHKIAYEVEDGGTYQLTVDWEEALERAAQVTGAFRSLRQQEERHTVEREVFRSRLAAHRQRNTN